MYLPEMGWPAIMCGRVLLVSETAWYSGRDLRVSTSLS